MWFAVSAGDGLPGYGFNDVLLFAVFGNCVEVDLLPDHVGVFHGAFLSPRNRLSCTHYIIYVPMKSTVKFTNVPMNFCATLWVHESQNLW